MSNFSKEFVKFLIAFTTAITVNAQAATVSCQANGSHANCKTVSIYSDSTRKIWIGIFSTGSGAYSVVDRANGKVIAAGRFSNHGSALAVSRRIGGLYSRYYLHIHNDWLGAGKVSAQLQGGPRS